MLIYLLIVSVCRVNLKFQYNFHTIFYSRFLKFGEIMRKTWVKKESLYPKPFYKRKIFMLFLILILTATSFIIYEFIIISKFSDSKDIKVQLIERTASSKAATVYKLVEVPVPSRREILP